MILPSRALGALLLSAVLAAAAASAAPACTDENDAVIASFQQNGKTVSGCSDSFVKKKCGTAKIKQACCMTCSAAAPPANCTNDDDGFVAHMKATGEWTSGISACVDAPRCTGNITNYCCKHCRDVHVTLEMPWVDDADPIHVYLSYGQSNCGGSASAELMKADGMYPQLFENDTAKSKVWFAGLTSKNDDDSFGITAAWAGVVGNSFGPEFAYGNRLAELTGNRVLIYKYCMGGTSAKQDWNPDFGANAWDKGTDNGTSAFLKDLRTSNPKREQYLQATYNLRLMREQLRAAGVAHEFKGVFWRQSSADSDSDWKKYGADQIRIFNAIRAEVEVPDLPIIMEGDGSRTNLQGGKVYAAKVLCHATVGTSSSNQQLSSTIGKGPGQCTPMISDPCTSHRHYNGELDNQFGWPVGFPEEYKFPKPGHSAATSQWVVRFQSDPGPPIKNPNMHDDYAGMWWNGVAMANAYVREHTDMAVPHAITEWDTWAKWPLKRCTSESPETETNYCWNDPSEACDLAQEALDAPQGMCTSVTAESCRATEAHYVNCPCACQDAATCTAEPPVIDRATLTYFPALPDPLPTPAGPVDATVATTPEGTPVVTIGTQPATTPATTTTPSSVCKDNNRAIIALAAKQNLTISGCGDKRVKRACSKFTELLEKCCVTCEGATQDSTGGAAPPKALGGNPFANTDDGSNTATAQSTTGPQGGDSSSCARRSRGRRVILQAAAVVAAMAMC